MDQNEAIKTVKRKITDIDSMKIDAQKKAVREGFDMDIIPTDLATYAGEAKNILRDLQSRNERMFLMTFLVVNFADSKQKLENDLLRATSVAQKYNCSLVRLVIQDQVWNRVSQNRDQGKSTWYFVDEFHLLLRGEVGAWSVEIWKRFRKWGGIPTGITQNIKDLLSSPEIENIFENSDFVYLLNQASGDRKILCERLNISNQQAAHISNAGPGEGLIFFGNVILPFVDDFPKDNELYSIMTTKLGETGKGENEHE